MEISAIVLAAGKGTRMKSELPKCAHMIIDKPMVEYVIDALKEVKIKNIVTVIGYGREIIQNLLQDKVQFAIQEEQLGTAHAVKQARSLLEGKEGITIIAIGDMPFIRKETFYSLMINHLQECAKLTVLTVEHPQPYGYGRIIRDDNGNVIRIVEERDCTKDETAIREINSSIYAVDNELLFDALDEITDDNSQKEFYLTDLVKVFNRKGLKVTGYKINDYNELSGINNKLQLSEMELEFQKKIIERHLLNGVSIHNPSTVVIGKDVVIGQGVSIMPNTYITGKSRIGKNTILGPGTDIKDCIIGENVHISYSIIEKTEIKDNETIGPYKVIKNN